MTAGRTRFFVVAGIAGAIVGELLAAAGAGALSVLVPATVQLGRAASLLYAGSLIALGLALGAWGAVALLRWWFRTIDFHAASPARRARARARTPRPIRAPRCTPLPGAARRVECWGERRA